MRLLEPTPIFIPQVKTLEGYRGRRLVFNVGGCWRWYPSYHSEQEYHRTLELLVQGALTALDVGDGGEEVGVSMDPFGSLWIEWLLPLWRWSPVQGISPDWDPAVARFARLFLDGEIPPDYSGACKSKVPVMALSVCADLVIRNYTPDSWFFSRIDGETCLYFHNTTSFGVCIPDDYDAALLSERVEALGLAGELLPARGP